MKQILIVLSTVIALTSSIYAGGGKAVAPATAVIAPINEVVSPIPFYIGLGAVATFIDRDPCPCNPNGPDLKDHRYGMAVRAGWDYNQYIGIEARALKTFGNDVFSETEHYGLYAKPQYHIADQMNVYGLLGYGRTTVDYTNGVLSSHNVTNGFAYGAGFEYDFGSDVSQGTYTRNFDGQGNQEKGWGMWVDIQHLLSNEGPMHTDLNLITAGITYDF